jgi:hypothetical protein
MAPATRTEQTLPRKASVVTSVAVDVAHAEHVVLEAGAEDVMIVTVRLE